MEWLTRLKSAKNELYDRYNPYSEGFRLFCDVFGTVTALFCSDLHYYTYETRNQYQVWGYNWADNLCQTRSGAKNWWVDVFFSVIKRVLTKKLFLDFSKIFETFSIFSLIFSKYVEKIEKFLNFLEKSKNNFFVKTPFETLKNTSTDQFWVPERIFRRLTSIFGWFFVVSKGVSF